MFATRGQQRGLHRRQEADAPDSPVAAATRARAARAVADAERLHPHREPALQDLGIGQPRVGHVDLDGAGPIGGGGGAGPAADGLVVLPVLVAEGEVVHRALAIGHDAQRRIERIDHVLAGLDIARHHGGRRVGRQHRARPGKDLQRLQAAGVQRDVVVHQGAEHIERRGIDDGRGAVEVAGQLVGRAGEVQGRRPGGGVHRGPHHDLPAAVDRRAVEAVAEPPHGAAHRLGGVGLDEAHVAGDGLRAIGPDHLRHRRRAGLARRHLRLQVGEVAVRRAGRPASRAQRRPRLRLQEPPVGHDRQGVQHHPLLVDRMRERRHRSGLDAADVGMVAARGDVEAGLRRIVLHEHRHHDGDIGQVGAAGVGVVEREGLARLQVRMAVAHGADAGAHAAQVHRHVWRVGHQPAVGVEQGAGEVEPFLDVHRMGGAFQRRAHGLRDAHEAAVEEFQGDRVGFVQRDGLVGGGGCAGEADQAIRLGGRPPAGKDGDLGVGADDQGGAVEGGECLGDDDWGFMPDPQGEHSHGPSTLRGGGRGWGCQR